MLKLVDIVKDYPIDNENVVHALKGVSLDFKEQEFVAILGPSGCGKTTLLNILGGLDRYTSGDLIVDNVSTKDFKDKDWDNYRNKRIGIVFQNYNLISHLSVLSNVEIAMTLSGVSPNKRKTVALDALEKVGLKDHINKKPNQLSGGQMQRVAIARAIVNNPGIILADEPTGALDSKTSIQIMDILKDLSKDHLVIMVTHNKELAYEYASRIISVSDGLILSDEEIREVKKVDVDKIVDEVISTPNKKEKTSMSFPTALNISAHNLITKKGRTIMTSIAGSIGIIGVALVLAVSNGFSNYITNMETQTLAQFPISVEEYGVTLDSLASSLDTSQNTKYPDDPSVVVKEAMTSALHANNLDDDYIEYVKNIDPKYVTSIQFNHSIQMNVLTQMEYTKEVKTFYSSQASLSQSIMSQGYWAQLPGNEDFILSQYDLIEGKYPSNKNEIVLVVDRYNALYESTLRSLGYDKYSLGTDGKNRISFEDILKHTFKIVSNNDYYTRSDNTTTVKGIFLKSQYELDKENLKLAQLPQLLQDVGELKIDSIIKLLSYFDLDMDQLKDIIVDISSNTSISQEELLNKFKALATERDLHYYTYKSYEEIENIYNDSSKGETLNVVGILRPKCTTMTPLLNSGIYYTSELTDFILNTNSPTVTETEDNRCQIAKDYENNLYFDVEEQDPSMMLKLRNIINNNNIYNNSDAFSRYSSQRKSLGTESYISSISIYPKDFASKKVITAYLDQYNYNEDGTEKKNLDKVIYIDLASTLTSGFGSMIDIVSYVLIAFASISLVVSSVMIGIITYTSVIERTKEIGILRSVGARKKDVGRLFKAEAVIIGFLSGLVGIGLSYILCIPINLILNAIFPEYGIGNIASLNPLHAFLLILLSVGLTYIASVIPSRVAAEKDPVIALRTE